jgi:hypothetical protein
LKSIFKKHVVASLLTATLLTATASAAGYYWFKTDSRVVQQGAISHIEINECASNKLWRSTDFAKVYSFKEDIRILQPEKISSDDLVRSELARCESQAIGAYIAEHVPELVIKGVAQQADAEGFFFSQQIAGSIVSIGVNDITIATDQFISFPVAGAEMVQSNEVRTYKIAFGSNVLIADKGKVATRSVLVPGAYISLVYRNIGKPYEKIAFDDIQQLQRQSDMNETSRVGAVMVRQTNPADERIYSDAVNYKWIEILTSNDKSRG